MNENIETIESPYVDPSVQDKLKTLAIKYKGNYDRNKPQICTFFEKGECNRGELCPFRHEDWK